MARADTQTKLSQGGPQLQRQLPSEVRTGNAFLHQIWDIDLWRPLHCVQYVAGYIKVDFICFFENKVTVGAVTKKLFGKTQSNSKL